MNKIKGTLPVKSKKSKERFIQLLILFIILCITGNLFQRISPTNIPYFNITDKGSYYLLILSFPFVAIISIIVAFRYKKTWGIISTISILALHFVQKENYNIAPYIVNSISYIIIFYNLFFIIKHIRFSIPFLLLLLLYSILFSIYTTILFALFIIVLRFIYLIIRENKSIIGDMGIKRFLLNIMRTIPVWSILILLLLPGFFIIQNTKHNLMINLYDEEIVTDYGIKENYSDLINDIDTTSQAKLSDIRDEFIDEISYLQKSNNNSVDAVKNAFDKKVPEAKDILPLLHPKPKKYQLLKLIENAIRKSVQNSIADERNQLEREYDIQVDSLSKKNNDLAESIIIMTNNNFKKIEDARSKMFEHYIFSLTIYGYISTLLFVYLILYSFIYAFSRVAINEQNNLFSTLDTGETRNVHGDIKCCGQKYTIGKQNKGIFYFSRRYDAFGCPPEVSIPFWKTSIISRLKNRIYMMNRVDMSKNISSVNFTIGEGKQFVEWKLKEGEEVIINYKNLFLFSESVTLKRVRSLKITSLLLGGIFFKVVEGPGKIVLLTNGKPLINDCDKNGVSASLENLLAWNRNAKFEIEANNNVINMFLSTYNLRLRSKDILIMDINTKGKAKSGLSRFIKSFAIPI